MNETHSLSTRCGPFFGRIHRSKDLPGCLEHLAKLMPAALGTWPARSRGLSASAPRMPARRKALPPTCHRWEHGDARGGALPLPRRREVVKMRLNPRNLAPESVFLAMALSCQVKEEHCFSTTEY